MYKLRYVIVFILFSLFVNACGGVTPIPSPTTTLPGYTATLPIPTVTPTPEPPKVELYRPSNTYDPKDSSLPELIIPAKNGLRLDPEWQISKIEYTYDWWGYSTEPVLGYEKIEKKGGVFFWNKQEIDLEKIQNFVNSLSNLHPAESLLVGTWHTDDYPTWQVDLSGSDGNHVLIYSSSNENPGYGPWHVIYNGRIYAEYGGEIGPAIGKLFEEDESAFAWKGGTIGDYHPDGLMGFETVGWPNQLWYGFDGLLPLAGSFHYVINPEIKELQGYIRGRYSIGGFGNLVVGKITTLRTVKLSVEDKQLLCEIEKLQSTDTYSDEWTFNCKMPNMQIGERYRYPIEIVFDLDTGQKLLTKGAIFGTTGSHNEYWVIPPSGEIQSAINNSNEFKELLKHTVVYTSLYQGKMNLTEDASLVLAGQIILLGEAEYKDERIKYSVVTPFMVKDGKFLRFDLSVEDIKKLIVDVMNSSLTKRFLVYYPDATINLWYSSMDNVEPPQMSGLLTDTGASGELKTKWGVCGGEYERNYPSSDMPLRMFSFNDEYLGNPWGVGLRLPDIRFILIENKTFVEQINFSRWSGKNDKELELFWDLLLPSQLNVSTIHPYLQIDYSIAKHKLRLTPPYYSTDNEFETYVKSLSLLPVPFEIKLLDDKAGKLYNYTVKDVDMVVQSDGTLNINSCEK
jgi:hypothetical protein